MSTLHEYKKSWDEKGYKIIECLTCGFKHLYPLPTKEETEKFYRENYYKLIKPFDYSIVNDQFINTKLNELIGNNYYISIFNTVKKFTRSIANNHKHRMMDIGCGNDLLAKFFHLKGWESAVIELSPDATNYLRRFDLEVFNLSVDEIETLPIKELSFINIQFVMEHLRNPISFLQKAYDALLPGGLLRIAVPNDFSEGQLAYQEHYKEKLHWVNLPDHINYFNFDSLSRLLEKNGFIECYRTTNFPLEFLLLGGMNYYHCEDERQKVNPFVSNFQNAFYKTGRGAVLKKLYEALAQQGFGRAAIIFAIKE